MRTVTVRFITVTNTCGAGVDTETTTYYGTGGTYSMPSAILLPNGLTYTFQYDACGNLNKVTYPTGGYTRYAYALEGAAEWGYGFGSDTGDWHPYQLNELVAKYVCSAPSVTMGATTAAAGDTCSVPEETTTYAPTETSPNTGNTGSTVTDPMGNYVVYQFTEANVPNYVPSLESSRSYYNSAGSLLKSVQTTYNCLCGNSPTPTLPQTQTTTFANGSGSQIQWTYNLEPFDKTDSPLMEKQEYDFGPSGSKSLLRTTKYEPLQVFNQSVYGWNIATVGAHILDRNESETVYNASGAQVAQTISDYDQSLQGSGGLGYVTEVSHWDNITGSTLNTFYEWDVGGIAKITDPNGNVTTYSYTDNYADGTSRNSNAYPTTITYASTVGGKHVEQKQYYWGSGLVAASCGENFSGTCKTGLSSVADYTSYSYDLMGRNVATVTGDGGSTTTCYSEVAGGSCSTGAYPLEETSTEAISTSGVVKKSTELLDGEGKVTQTQLNTDPGCNGISYIDITYDADERVSTKSNPFCTTGDPTYGVTTYTYDGLSRVIQVTNPDNTSTTSTYTGRAVLSADEGNGTVAVQRVSQTDSLGRLTNICEVSSTTQQGTSNNTPSSCGLDAAATGFLTSYSYDPLGNLLSVTQGGESRSFIYDSFSRLISATNPESGNTTYGYDNDGNLTSKKSALGITTYSYDALNRLTGKSYSDEVTPSACFRYDAGTNGNGRLSTEWTQASTPTCPATPPSSGVLTERTFAAYDLMGRVATDEQCSTPGNCTGTPNTVNYGYDLAGDVASFTNGLTGASTMSFSNVYDSAGRLSTVTGPTTAGAEERVNLFAAADYNAAGAVVNAQIGPGIALQRAYNKNLLPVSETDQVATTPGSATIQITGAEQLNGSSTGTITFSGTEQSEVSDGETIYDDGLFIISIDGGQAIQLEYGQSYTPQSLAANLAGVIGCSYGPVKAVAIGATVTLTSCTSGTGTDYSISAYFDGHSSNFASPSFAVTSSGATMTVPPATFATGTIFIGGEYSGEQVPEVFFESGQYGGPASVGTSATSTPSSIASELAAQIPPCRANQYFSAVASGPVIDLTSCTAGAAGDYPITTGGSGSFTLTASGTTLTGGENLPGVYDTGTVNLTMNGIQIASAPYDASSTPSSIASALVTSGSSNPYVTLTASGANLTMVAQAANGDGTYSDYSYALTVDYDTAQFTAPSFSASSTSGSLVGGENAPLYNWAINSYAPDGDVLSMTDSVMGTWSYTYDDHNRLVNGSATAGTMSGLNMDWTYDRYGNRWSQSASGTGNASVVQTSMSFSGNNNRIDQFSSNYDQDGNLKGDGVNTYTYDGENRLLTVNGQATYIYDAEGTRVAKLGSGGTVSSVYILSLGGQQMTEINASGVWVHSNVFTSGGRLLATYEGPAGTSTAGYHYHLTDWLGTERMQTSASGNENEQCTSYPFGDGLSCTGQNAIDATEQHFTGKERDTESGLDYFGARYYASNMGRWMSPDLVNVTEERMMNPSSTLNKYAYAANNPLKYIDPDGQDITIFYEAGVPGHIMMMAYDPSLNSAATRSFGPDSDFATGSAGSLSTMFGLPVPATTTFGFDKLTSADAIRKNFASMTIKTSPEVTQQVVQALVAHSGDKWYTTGGYACASSCAKILHQIGQLKGICCDHALVPNAFFNNLYEGGYGNGKASLSFSGNAVFKPGTNYGAYQPSWNEFDVLFLMINPDQQRPQRNCTINVTPDGTSGDC